MAEKTSVDKNVLQRMLNPKRKRNRLTLEQKAQQIKEQGIKNAQREIEALIKDLPEAQELIKERQNLRVKLSSIKNQIDPAHPTFIQLKIDKLNEKLEEAHMIMEHPELITTALNEQIGKKNKELGVMASRLKAKLEKELENDKNSSNNNEMSA